MVEENGTQGASSVVSFDFLFSFLSRGVRWVMCMGRSVTEGIYSHAYISKGFQIFFKDFLFSRVFCDG